MVQPTQAGDPEKFERRAGALQSRLGSAGAGAAVLAPGPSLYYVSGIWEEPMERMFVCVVPSDRDPVIVAPSLYDTQLAETTWIEDVRTYDDAEGPRDRLVAVIDRMNLEGTRVLLDPRMWTAHSHVVRSVLPAVDVGLSDEVIEPLRSVKDEAEIGAIRRASAIADDVVRSLRENPESVLNSTECAVARRIERELLDRGGDSLAFEVVVGSGPNGAKPHHRCGDRSIEPGDPVVLDFGTRVDRYPSDQTRTMVFGGEPPSEFEAVYRAVRDAQEIAVRAVEPGIEAGEIDERARSLLEERGYGDEFVHRTGHGVGIEVHEPPSIAGGNDRPLEPGMVISVEPGAYLPGRFGVRIEDLVLVTETGGERLNESPRDYRVPAEP
ncbi:MAG: M24 family metallopeptidase [Halanaeroarchaeum sp.]